MEKKNWLPDAGEPSRAEEAGILRDLVRRHQVCWEIWPEFQVDREGNKVQVGVELELLGMHLHPEEIPDCGECLKVYADLRRIAHWILPGEEGDRGYEIGAFDASIHYGSRRGFRGEISLPVKIPRGWGPGGGEGRALIWMEDRLKDLGAHKGEWPDSQRG